MLDAQGSTLALDSIAQKCLASGVQHLALYGFGK